MTLSAFPAITKLPKSAANVQDLTLRDFSGGLRVSENETNLRSRFSVVADNVFRDEEQGMKVRYGTKELATCSSVILETAFFNNSVICFLQNGNIEAVNLAGVVVPIWNTAIAALLPGSPAAWSAGALSVDTAVFGSALIVVNGQDKPLSISTSLVVTYLQDPATGSNLFTPITSFVTTAANYCIMAGFNDTDEIFISSAGTSGVWPGDAAPNNSISIKLGAYTATTGTKILGVADFRNSLVVFFEEYVLVLELDVFDAGGDHTPKVVDTLQDTKIINHRSLFTTNKELAFASRTGVQTLTQQQFSAQLSPADLTADLGKLYAQSIAKLDIGSNFSYVVRDPAEKRLFVFLRQIDETYQVFAMTFKDGFKQVSWSKILGWSFQGGVETGQNRLVFFEDTKLYLYGNGTVEDEDYYTDKQTDVFAGTPIDFAWELPWFDANSRIRSKGLVNVAMETRGTAEFALSIFIDNIYKRLDGSLNPTMVLQFRGGDTPGYGVDVGGFGGGRRTNDERMYKMPSKFNIVKLRFTGSTSAALKFSSISLIYRKAQGFRR